MCQINIASHFTNKIDNVINNVPRTDEHILYCLIQNQIMKAKNCTFYFKVHVMLINHPMFTGFSDYKSQLH